MTQDQESPGGLLDETCDCRAENIGLDGFVECLDVGPKACRYALPFGYAFLCNHPHMREFVEKTRNEKMHGVAQN